ncbi:MAG: hypothetical protein IIT85_08990, partial [Prevotella sp.]|nr:hypothetical protein [Prevotella sp.]
MSIVLFQSENHVYAIVFVQFYLSTFNGFARTTNDIVFLSTDGVQGPGQSQNLRDNGFNVIVGQRAGKTFEKAKADGWKPGETL